MFERSAGPWTSTQPATPSPGCIPSSRVPVGPQHCGRRAPGPRVCEKSAFTDPKALVSNIFGSYRATRCINNAAGTVIQNPRVWFSARRTPRTGPASPTRTAARADFPPSSRGRDARRRKAPAQPPDYEIPGLSHYTCARAPIAQLVELRTFNPQVPGSSPGGGTTGARPMAGRPLFPGSPRSLLISCAFCEFTQARRRRPVTRAERCGLGRRRTDRAFPGTGGRRSGLISAETPGRMPVRGDRCAIPHRR